MTEFCVQFWLLFQGQDHLVLSNSIQKIVFVQFGHNSKAYQILIEKQSGIHSDWHVRTPESRNEPLYNVPWLRKFSFLLQTASKKCRNLHINLVMDIVIDSSTQKLCFYDEVWSSLFTNKKIVTLLYFIKDYINMAFMRWKANSTSKFVSHSKKILFKE